MVPKEFFVKERRMYANWQFAFWRELFQNSIDASSSNIKINITDKGNGLIGVDFEDNGNGMSREVLENVYFKLGASTKSDGSTVGGFGRARILTCFSMKNYTIHTQNSLVQGDGGSYEITEVDPRQGCLIQLEIENENFESLKKHLEEYLSLSQLFCLVTINGERWTTWSHRRQMTRTLDLGNVTFANVFVNKSSANHRLLVRVNGTVMYYQFIRAKAQVIVEIDPRLSREVLTANRDGMHNAYLAVLNSFIEELSVDTMSALTNKLRKKNATIPGRGLIRSVNRNKPDKNLEKPAFDGVNKESLKNTLTEIDDLVDKISEINKALNQNSEDTNNVKISSLNVGDNHALNLPDIFIIDDTSNDEVRKVIDRYNPNTWVVCERNGIKYNKGRDLYKLMILWKIACQSAIDSLMKAYFHVGEVVWGLGWVFSDENEACCKHIHGGNALLLNPVDKNGKMAYSLSSKEDRKKLMALAKHEVSHILVDWHNEQFAGILTSIDAHFDEKETFRKMKEAISEDN